MAAAAPLRRIAAMAIPGIEPGGADMALPRVEWLAPDELLVDEAYQRNLSERSVGLIRRIVADWDWRRFKPPIVTAADAGWHVLDGQHTAIAAATHPRVDRIPVLVVEAGAQADRARAFLGHNRDRINVTATQMHVAAVAAGDPDAVTVAQVCERAGVTVLKNPPGQGLFRPRQTMAVACLGALVNRRGALVARQILEVLAQAGCAPITAGQIKAAEMLLKEPEYADQITTEELVATIVAVRDTAAIDAKVFAAAHDVPAWKALGIIWFRSRHRGRRALAAPARERAPAPPRVAAPVSAPEAPPAVTPARVEPNGVPVVVLAAGREGVSFEGRSVALTAPEAIAVHELARRFTRVTSGAALVERLWAGRTVRQAQADLDALLGAVNAKLRTIGLTAFRSGFGWVLMRAQVRREKSA